MSMYLLLVVAAMLFAVQFIFNQKYQQSKGEGCDAAACGDACSSGQTSNSVEHCHCRKVKAVTYGEWAWVDFDRLWDTGHEEKGGLVLYRWE